MTKFTGIKYPIFCLDKKPYSVEFTLDKIFIRRYKHSHRETADDKTLAGDYFARLAQLNKRIEFDYTCKDLQQLVYSGAKWGIDSDCRLFDLSEKMYCKSLKLPIVKINENLIWFKGISYPFKIDTNDELHKIKDVFGVLVSVHNEWHIKKFTFEDSPINGKIII